MKKINGEAINILFVEDDPAHAEIALRNLKKSKMANKVYHVSDGQMALDFLYHQGEFVDPDTYPKPHIILLDLRLPKVDGIEVLAKIRAHPELHTTPIVVLTTSQAEIDIVKAYSYNVNSYLIKPLDFEKFANLLDSFGFYWLVWNKYPYM